MLENKLLLVLKNDGGWYEPDKIWVALKYVPYNFSSSPKVLEMPDLFAWKTIDLALIRTLTCLIGGDDGWFASASPRWARAVLGFSCMISPGPFSGDHEIRRIFHAADRAMIENHSCGGDHTREAKACLRINWFVSKRLLHLKYFRRRQISQPKAKF